MTKSDKLGMVDHSTITYSPFRRSFYIEADELKRMSEKLVADYRLQLEDIKVSKNLFSSLRFVFLLDSQGGGGQQSVGRNRESKYFSWHNNVEAQLCCFDFEVYWCLGR